MPKIVSHLQSKDQSYYFLKHVPNIYAVVVRLIIRVPDNSRVASRPELSGASDSAVPACV